VVFTDFKLFNQSQYVVEDKKGVLTKSISETSEIKLNYNQNNISFEFSSLSMLRLVKININKLEGFDKEWIYTSANRRFITYKICIRNLYIVIMGLITDGIWNNNPTSLK